MGGGWNVGSPFSFEKVPAQFQGFVREKQLQLVNNLLTSATAGVLYANGAALLAGDASMEVLTTIGAMVPVLALAALASGASTLLIGDSDDDDDESTVCNRVIGHE